MKRRLMAIIWLILSVSAGALNDVFSRYALGHLPVFEITFFRYFFATITILPFLIFNKKLFKTNHLLIHFLRGLDFYIAATLWVVGLKTTPLASAVVIGFASPFFIIILCHLFLGEKVSWICCFTSIISFIAIVYSLDLQHISLTGGSFILLFSCIFFALSDFMNKKFINKESNMTMIFYFNFFAFAISIPFAIQDFVMPTVMDLFYTLCLGISANCLLYFLLRAFMLADAAFLSPFRFLEFIVTALLGYVFFSEIPQHKCYIAMAIILTCNIILFIFEKENKKKENVS